MYTATSIWKLVDFQDYIVDYMSTDNLFIWCPQRSMHYQVKIVTPYLSFDTTVYAMKREMLKYS